MWTAMSIGKKIWTGLAILIAGYFVSTAIGTVNGKNLQSHLIHVSEYLFPASHQSKTALTGFNEQVKFYNDAIMMGDSELLDAAKVKSEEVLSSLTIIAKLDMIDPGAAGRLESLIKRLGDFNAKAHPAYSAMSGGDSERDMEFLAKDMATLAKEKDRLSAELQDLTVYFSNALKSMLIDAGKAISRQVITNGVVFVLVVLISGLVTSFIIARFVTRPLLNTLSMIRDIAEGEGDLTKRLDVTSKDEVGELARWFNVFVGNLQDMVSHIAGNAKTLNESSNDLLGLSDLLTRGAGEIS